MATTVVCFLCNEVADSTTDSCKCDGCRQIYHYICAGLTASEAKVMELKTKRTLRFFCETCSEGLRLLPIMQKQIKKLETQMSDILNKINNQNEASKNSIVENTQNRSVVQNQDCNTFISEMEERSKRARNVMIYNVAESPERNTEDSIKEDLAAVKELISHLLPTDDCLVKAFRVGKSIDDKPRPIKAVFTSPEIALRVLRGKSSIKDSIMKITADLTLAQREHIRNLYGELDRRRAAGENHIYIKYLHGIPKIVTGSVKKKLNSSGSLHYSGNITVYYQNVRGLRTKIDDLMSSVLLCRYDVLVLTETWLDDSVRSAELGLRDFNIYRTDRSDRTSSKSRGGGVLVGIRKSMCSWGVSIECTTIEQLFVKIKIDHNVIVVGGIYIPPNSPVNIYESHCASIDSVLNQFPRAALLLWGDYNLPRVKWDDISGNSYGVGCGGPAVRVLCNTFAFHDLRQLNKIENCNNTILDLFWSNIHGSQVCLADDVLLPLDRYHPALCATVPVVADGSILQYDTFFYDFKKGDLIGLNDYLSAVDWDGALESDRVESVDVLLDRFYDILTFGIEQFIPLSRLKVPKFPRWYSGELKNLIFEKKKAHKKYKRSNNFQDYLTFSSLREQCKIMSKNCYQQYVQNTENSIPTNIKSFWNFVGDKLNSVSLPQSMHLWGHEGNTSMDVAMLFSRYFKSVYRRDVVDEVPTTISNNNININSCTIDLQTVYTSLCSLDINKGHGPDGVPPLLLHTCRCSLAKPLWKLFSLSLNTGSFPDRWKKSYIIPIHKNGDKSNILNYRPVSILSTIPKLFENIITNQIKRCIGSAIIQQQHGFSTGKSVTTNMMCFVQYVLDALERHSQVDTIYTDFSKAFDTVNIRVLCAKLNAFGFGGSMMEWMESYLTGRTQSVRLRGAVSDEFAVTSGVPQGSHLGPFLFNIFINDIEVCLACPFLLFADDCKIFKVIDSVFDCYSLQADLDSFVEWCRINRLSLNIDKCQIMSFYRGQKKINFSYCLNDQSLASVGRVKDLGIVLDPKLDFHFHFDYIINKALKLLGFLCRVGRNFSNIFTFKLLYQSLVRSVMEYSSPVWSPTYLSHISSLEMVQNKFLKFVSVKLNIPSQDYSATAMRSIVGLPRLSDRRKSADLLFLCKIVNSTVNCPMLLAQIGILVPQKNTRVHYSFARPFHRCNYGLHSPIARLLSEGNGTDVDIFNLPRTGFRSLMMRRADTVNGNSG